MDSTGLTGAYQDLHCAELLEG